MLVMRQLRSFSQNRRKVFLRLCALVALSVCLGWFLLAQRTTEWTSPLEFLPGGMGWNSGGPDRMPATIYLDPLPDRVPCIGPRGQFLSRSLDDELESLDVHIPYPVPFFGSHEALSLELSLMTPDGRYGPYGYGEDNTEYITNRTRVDWDKVNWGALQNRCFERNEHRFPTAAKNVNFGLERRFAFRNQSTIPEIRTWDQFNHTRRTALVLRSWGGYEYKPMDLINIRSLIVETALRSGGEYAVLLLVDIKEPERGIFASQAAYDSALQAAGIPPELQSITILWDNNLLQSWYPKVEEHDTMFQVMQPMQLLALHYPEFDHYWQFELDQRFLGDAGKFLDAVSEFAKQQPRKQALERATFPHMQSELGSYQEFAQAVNHSNNGSSHIWGPLRIPEIRPIGPKPPVKRAQEDDFTWGVGEDADCIVTSVCADVVRSNTWVFRHWITGFAAGTETPRWWCPPAIQRASRALLLEIHRSQLQKGLALPSEATLVSFALYHGLKISYPPLPVYVRASGTEEETLRKQWFDGGPAASPDGWGNPDPQNDFIEESTWWWTSRFPGELMEKWFAANNGEQVDDLPSPLIRHGGKVYLPNLVMHPFKRG